MISIYDTAIAEIKDRLKDVSDSFISADFALHVLEQKAGDSKEWQDFIYTLEVIRQRIKDIEKEEFQKVFDTLPANADAEWVFDNPRREKK